MRYGQFKVYPGELDNLNPDMSRDQGRKTKRAHTVAFYLTYGRWPQPQGCHKCNNPLCCNVVNRARHVYEGTPEQNMEDRNQGRNGAHMASGERSAVALLTDEQYDLMWERYQELQSYKQVADEFGVSAPMVYQFVQRRKNPGPKNRLTADVKATIRDLIAFGRTNREIAEIVGVYASAVGRIRRRDASQPPISPGVPR